jgi:hypothetical protein
MLCQFRFDTQKQELDEVREWSFELTGDNIGSCFPAPAAGTYGNLASGNILGPGSIRIDMGLTRTFRVRENQSLQFRAEAFNLPNHVNPGTTNAPVTALNNSHFGRIQSAADPRILQLALKYVF